VKKGLILVVTVLGIIVTACATSETVAYNQDYSCLHPGCKLTAVHYHISFE